MTALREAPYLLRIKHRNLGNVLHLICKNHESLKQILDGLPPKCILEIIKERNQDGNNVLHEAAGNPESLKQLLECLPKEIILEFAKEKSKDGGHNALHLAASRPESLKQLLEYLPEGNVLELLKEKDINGSDALHYVATVRDLESLKQLLKLLPEKDRLNAIKQKNIHHHSVLSSLIKEPQSFIKILGILPEEDRLEAIKHRDTHEHNNILEKILNTLNDNFLFKDFAILNSILKILPEKARIEVIEGTLYKVIEAFMRINMDDLKNYHDSLKELKNIIKLLPEYGVLEKVVNQKHNNRFSILDILKIHNSLPSTEVKKIIEDAKVDHHDTKSLTFLSDITGKGERERSKTAGHNKIQGL